jgi:undecaprenyl-diphosphatase
VLAVIILAVVQGLTEFLPVSSDGHLVLSGHLLGSLDPRFLDLVIFLHGGSLLVLLVHYRRDLWALATRTLGARPEAPELRRLLGAILVATGITGTLGLLAKEAVERLQQPAVAAAGLLFTGAALLSVRFAPRGGRGEVGVPTAALVALFQTLAILPGVSRSGSTIAAGLWCGLAPAAAARFSFLLAIPAIGGALLVDLRHIQTLPLPAGHLAAGFLICTLVSAAALRLMLHYAQQARLGGFGVYCVALGGLALLAVGLGF